MQNRPLTRLDVAIRISIAATAAMALMAATDMVGAHPASPQAHMHGAHMPEAVQAG